jgi:hypothetical protein
VTRTFVLRAFGAGADDREVGEASFVAKLLPDDLADSAELFRSDRSHPAAPLAVEVGPFILPAEGIEPGAVAEVNVADESVALQQLEIAVDRAQVQAQTSHHVLR